MTDVALRGLYAITPSASDRLPSQVQQAISGGARLIQYRDKGSDPRLRHDCAEALLALCHDAGVAFIINDDLDLAAAIGANGVHLGRDDGDPRAARARLGDSAIIGISCYDDLARAEAAANAGASYVAFGSFFPSSTKPHAVRAHPQLLTEARARIGLPLVAIGGITPHNGGPLIAAGADMLAIVSGIFAAPDISAAARAYHSLFQSEISE